MDFILQFEALFRDCTFLTHLAAVLLLLTLVVFFAFVFDVLLRKYFRLYFRKTYFLLGSFLGVELILWILVSFLDVSLPDLFFFPLLSPLPFSLCS